ncbi:hypothetical protein [Tsukamurella soli]|uniref:Catalytic LigB subunit of aromatic ring-opening dioxygenase n=1 Tax=Tsukamurella soli TaxID=644556 RepID=A0ABP8JMB4_9ACTN
MDDHSAGPAAAHLPVIVVPGSPLLVPELAGVPGDPDADAVRAAAVDAARWLAARALRWVVVADGGGDRPGTDEPASTDDVAGAAPGTVGTFAGFGAPVPVALAGPAPSDPATATPGWPTPLLVAAWLRGAVATPERAPQLVGRGGGPDGVVFVLDGPITLTPRAPGGHRPEDVAVFDALVASVVDGLGPVGSVLPTWDAAAEACRGRAVTELYRGAPFGVGYLVATAEAP